MKKILIITPHFPPSNLAAVHRSRLFAQHLPSFGWTPIILMADEKYYEEQHDYNLVKLLPENLRLEKVKAFPVTKPRLIGDLGLRAFFQITNKATRLIRKEKIDFLYIPVPSFYMALIGRIVHARTGIKYGIDYIDPWVHTFSGSEKMFSRHWFSTKLSGVLEPFAVKKASLITGVAEGYYAGVAERNPHLQTQAVFAAMPYGGEKEDHQKIKQLNLKPYLFEQKKHKLQLIYAGAMLPKAYKPMERIFSEIQKKKEVFSLLEIHFIGTGKNASDADGYNIKKYAEQYGLWQQQVFEYPKRIPYLDVLIHLEVSGGAFILGSTEPHYTPSKVYQAVLAAKPIWAVLNAKSTACHVIKNSGAGIVLEYDGENDLDKISDTLEESFITFTRFIQHFTPGDVKQDEFEKYSAKNVTGILVNALNKITGEPR